MFCRADSQAFMSIPSLPVCDHQPGHGSGAPWTFHVMFACLRLTAGLHRQACAFPRFEASSQSAGLDPEVLQNQRRTGAGFFGGSRAIGNDSLASPQIRKLGLDVRQRNVQRAVDMSGQVRFGFAYVQGQRLTATEQA